MSAYDRDLHAWAQTQADALRRRSANEVDWDNVAEEIESLGKQQLSELTHRLEVLLTHLLKWAHQPERRGRSWSNTISEQRRKIANLFAENPSLQPMRDKAFDDAYLGARARASTEADLDIDTFPATPSLSWTQVTSSDFWPEAVVRPVDGAE